MIDDLGLGLGLGLGLELGWVLRDSHPIIRFLMTKYEPWNLPL